MDFEMLVNGRQVNGVIYAPNCGIYPTGLE